MEVTIGGERLGSGNKNKVWMKEYERSTHNMSYVWRSTMAAGTLVPFLVELALPGDTFDINLNVDVLTHPTIGPLFGSYKIQLDVFQTPIRLYNAMLHMNMLNIGLDMSKVLLPQVEATAPALDLTIPIDNQQINPSCLLSYLGMRGLGWNDTNTAVTRRFNAVPYLAYWDIYKQYYANKSEEKGYCIHKSITPSTTLPTAASYWNFAGDVAKTIPVSATMPIPPYSLIAISPTYTSFMVLTATGLDSAFELSQLKIAIREMGAIEKLVSADLLYNNYELDIPMGTITLTAPHSYLLNYVTDMADVWYDENPNPNQDVAPQIQGFDLVNIDNMRTDILQHTSATPFVIDSASTSPYRFPFETNLTTTPEIRSQKYSQEGLALKTYQSDLFNNWMSTEWIDGPDGITAVTAIDTTGGSFTIDELNMSKKIYDMLNRIALSGGTYDDWLDTVYTHQRHRSSENPMYIGGLISELVFQEVVSNSATTNQPLGTLAGRGRTTDKRKGGNIIAKVDEPSYLMGIVSLTPRIDYSQGNKWDTNLKTMNDLHKPALDEIGFQDLITDQMAWFDTEIDTVNGPQFQSAGKQPAWINYMTNVNKVYGNFADQNQQMFMVLNRRYDPVFTGTTAQIADLTTYIDPTKFNHIFADTRLDAQNFWTQIGVNIQARRKMSAKVIPNL